MLLETVIETEDLILRPLDATHDEPSAEYSSFYRYDEEEEVDERRFNTFVNLGINAEDMLGMLDNTISDYPVTERDLLPYTYPPAEQLRGVRSILLGS